MNIQKTCSEKGLNQCLNKFKTLHNFPPNSINSHYKKDAQQQYQGAGKNEQKKPQKLIQNIHSSLSTLNTIQPTCKPYTSFNKLIKLCLLIHRSKSIHLHLHFNLHGLTCKKQNIHSHHQRKIQRNNIQTSISSPQNLHSIPTQQQTTHKQKHTWISFSM